MALSTYSTGTVSVAANSASVIGDGAIWSGENVRPGDLVYINNLPPGIEVKDVTDATHLTLIVPWTGSTQTSVPYTISQGSKLRLVGAEASATTSRLVAALNKEGFYHFVGPSETVPDPSLGDDGQYAFQPTTGNLWIKAGGAWVLTDDPTQTLVQPPLGCLTLIPGTPVMNSDVVGATVVHWVGTQIPVWNGSRFINRSWPSCSQSTTDTTKSPAAVASNTNYDLFGWIDSDGTKRVTRGPAWASPGARGSGSGTTELELLNGIYVNKYAITNGPAARCGTYVGGFHSDLSGTVTWRLGSVAGGGGTAYLSVYTAYRQNQRLVIADVREASPYWVQTSSAVTPLAGITTNICMFFSGLGESFIDVEVSCHINVAGTGAIAYVGFGFDGFSTFLKSAAVQTAGSIVGASVSCRGRVSPVIGWHYAAALQASDGAHEATFIGGGAEESIVVAAWM